MLNYAKIGKMKKRGVDKDYIDLIAYLEAQGIFFLQYPLLQLNNPFWGFTEKKLATPKARTYFNTLKPGSFLCFMRIR
jgi:hypothetical protein